LSKTKAWSFSALNNFESCPKKYWHLSIEKDYKEVEGEPIIYGKKVHKALEQLVRDGIPLPNELAHMKPYVQKFIDAPGEKLVEQQLAITKDFQPTDWRDWNGAWVRVVIDLAIKGNKHAVLIDYKTGKMKDDEFTQLGLASAVFMAHHPDIETCDTGYLWTEANGKITKRTFSRGDITGLWNAILPRVARFQRAFDLTEYPPSPSGLCRRHCPITSCPHNGE
jgi:hypothetical protein